MGSLRITWVLPAFAKRPGGGFRVVYRYASLLAERGHDVTVVHGAWLEPWQYRHPLDSRHEPRNAIRGLVDLSQPRPQGPGWEVVDPRVTLRYVPTLAPRNIPDGDVVLATAWRTAESVARYPAAKGAKAYFLQSLETWDAPATHVEATWRLPLRKFAISEWLVGEGKRLTDDPIVHVPNAIDPSVFRCRQPIESRPVRVAMLASTASIKGMDVGLAVLDRSRQRRPDLQAVLFGVRRRAPGIPAWIDYEQNPSLDVLVDDVYNGSSVFLCPSRSEGWALPPAEAMACGCAVVSTALEGMADYAVDGENILLAPVDDIEGLAAALVRVLDDDGSARGWRPTASRRWPRSRGTGRPIGWRRSSASSHRSSPDDRGQPRGGRRDPDVERRRTARHAVASARASRAAGSRSSSWTTARTRRPRRRGGGPDLAAVAGQPGVAAGRNHGGRARGHRSCASSTATPVCCPTPWPRCSGRCWIRRSPGWWHRCSWISHPRPAPAGPRRSAGSSPAWPTGPTCTRPPRATGEAATWSVDFAIGACQLMRRVAFEGVGGLDESYFYGPEDVDFCLRLRDAGWEIVQAGDARCIHPPRRRNRKVLTRRGVAHGWAVVRHLARHRPGAGRPRVGASGAA